MGKSYKYKQKATTSPDNVFVTPPLCNPVFLPKVIFFIHSMSDEGIRAPARKLDEFEELVYEYTSRMGLGNEEVR